MKLELYLNGFLEALERSVRVLARTKIDSGAVFLTVTKEGTDVSATSYDTEVMSLLKSDLTDGRGRKIALDGKSLLTFLKAQTTELVTLDVDKKNATVITESARARFPLLDTEGIPDVTVPENIPSLSLDKGRFATAMETLTFTVSEDPSRMSLNGIGMFLSGNQLVLVGTDGHSLGRVRVDVENPDEMTIPEKGVILHRSGFSSLVKLLSERDEVSIFLDERNLWFDAEDVILKIRLIEDEFPSYQQVIPRTEAWTLKTGLSTFTAAVKSVSCLLEKHEGVTLCKSPEGDKITIRAETLLKGLDGTTQVEDFDLTESEGNFPEFKLDHKRLNEVLSHFPVQDLVISGTDAFSAVKFSHPESSELGGDVLFLVMPIADESPEDPEENTPEEPESNTE